MDRVVVAIPARYGSTRFPGKPLAMLCGKPVIRHVYEKAAASTADLVVVATDDARIHRAVELFGGKAVMTDPGHASGSDRIYEAVAGMGCDIVVNVQGDEPLIPTEVIDALIAVMKSHPEYEISTVAVPATPAEMHDCNRPKVVFDSAGRALYFSRSLIPFLRDGGIETTVYVHWGIYAYRSAALEKFVNLPVGRLEMCEKLEQLRALENGMDIRVIVSHLSSVGIDTPEDLIRAEQRLREVGS